MNKLPAQKIQMSIFILSLIIASIACNLPDADEAIAEVAIEECIPTSRDLYESYAAQLGQAPETPQCPERALYGACYLNGKLSSIRMSDGCGPNDIEQTKNEENNSISPSTGADESVSIPAGTYIGEFPWNDAAISELIVNEIVIEVSSNGLVSGSATRNHSHTEVHGPAEDKCTSYYEYWTSYTISGQIADTYREPVKVQNSSYEISDRTDCGGEYKRWDDECSCDGLLTISDGVLTITCGLGSDCGCYLTAKK